MWNNILCVSPMIITIVIIIMLLVEIKKLDKKCRAMTFEVAQEYAIMEKRANESCDKIMQSPVRIVFSEKETIQITDIDRFLECIAIAVKHHNIRVERKYGKIRVWKYEPSSKRKLNSECILDLK